MICRQLWVCVLLCLFSASACVAPTCDYDGVAYQPGDTFRDREDCNTCTCGAGGSISCTLRYCAPVPPGSDGARCQSHGECASGLCLDTCTPVEDALFVDNRNGACSGGDGLSRATAACTIEAALPLVDARRSLILVAPSTADYGEVLLPGGTYRIVALSGPGGAARLLRVMASGSGDRTLRGFEISRPGGAGTGVRCRPEGTALSGLRLHRSQVLGYSEYGLVSEGCAVELDGVLFSGNQLGAMRFEPANEISIFNSFIVRNPSRGGAAIRLASTRKAKFYHNTIADNGALAMDCEVPEAVNLSHSIFVDNGRSGGSQLSRCAVRDTVVGAGDGVPGGIGKSPEFVAPLALDYRLTNSAVNADCCIDRAAPMLPWDYFGTRRPAGRAADLGAHEAR